MNRSESFVKLRTVLDLDGIWLECPSGSDVWTLILSAGEWSREALVEAFNAAKNLDRNNDYD